MPYAWDASIGIIAYLNHTIPDLMGAAQDGLVIALALLLVGGKTWAQPLLALFALIGLEGRWSMLTSVWFWLPHMDGRRGLVLMTTAANVLTLVVLAVPLFWRHGSRRLWMALPRRMITTD